MTINPLHLVLRPRDTECRSHIVWDRDALILSSTFTYSDENADPHNLKLSDRIDRDFGIEGGSYRLILGEMDILLDSNMRIRSMEIRTNPSMWQRGSLLPFPIRPDAVFVDFAVEYDENRIASYEFPIQIVQDQARHELNFSFGDYTSSHWAAGADSFIIGMTADCYLSEFRLIDWNPL